MAETQVIDNESDSAIPHLVSLGLLDSPILHQAAWGQV